MKKGRVAALITAAVLLAAGAGSAYYYFKIYKNDSHSSEQTGMKEWNSPSLSGLTLSVPDDYTEKEAKYFDVSYTKSDAHISLTWDDCDNDLKNYASNAVEQYRSITDGFEITDERDEEIKGTQLHVVEFNYRLSLESGEKNYSCLAAYALNGQKAYVLTCTCDADNYKNYIDDFVRTYKTMCLVPELDQTDGSTA